MKLKLLPLLFTLLCLSIQSQDRFKSGYIIDKNNKKTTCLIKDLDWKNNPSEFEYKLSENGTVLTGNLENINEFEIFNSSKYVFFEGNIEKSSLILNNLSRERTPQFKKEKLFLKVLVDGKAKLYAYFETNLYKYFYSKDDSKIAQLIYKKYLINNSETDVRTNFQFRQTLKKELVCSSISENSLLKVTYTQSSLTQLFLKYNKCIDPNFKNTISEKRKGKFYFYLKGGLLSSSLTTKNEINADLYSDFGNQLGLTFGAEFEYNLPFNNNKMSIVLEPTFGTYKSDIVLESSKFSGGKLKVQADYKYINIAMGLKHYFFLKDKKDKFFANALLTYGLTTSSSIKAPERNDRLYDLEVGNNLNFAVGFGYLIKEKISLEIRYRSKRNILPEYVSWISNYNGLSLLLAYKI